MPAGAGPAAPRCSWTPAVRNTIQIATEGPVQAEGGELPFYTDSSGNQITRPGPGDRVLHVVECPPGSGAEHFEYATLAEHVDRQALIDQAHDEARAAIPQPSINISPAPDVGVPAQLGIWLAVDDPGQINAFANVGPVWASVTARFAGVTWDMGNSDIVECTGPGTPYPEGSNLLEQGPCGYTYTRVSDIGFRQVVATGHWEVQLTTSDGVNRMLDPIDAAFQFDYEVYEIITVVEA